MDTRRFIGFSLLAALMVTGCSEEKTTASSETAPTKTVMPQQHPATFDTSVVTGNAIETFDAGGFTYVKISTSKEPIWAAGPVTQIKKGDNVSFSREMLMKNFHSNSLNRDFEAIYFVNTYTVNGEVSAPVTKQPHQNIPEQK